MKSKSNDNICPVERAGFLSNRLRKLIHNPEKILSPYINKGMTILDVGCGPGFFSIEAAKLTGHSGKVIACDIQEGMLKKLKNKIENTEYEKIISLHKSSADSPGIKEKVDLVIIFYVFHEIVEKHSVLQNIIEILKPGGKIIFVEPLGHVSKRDYYYSKEIFNMFGLKETENPKILFSRSTVFVNTKKA